MSCRACSSGELFLAVDLELMPIAEAFLNSDKDPSYLYSTKMYICKQCGLGQLDTDINKTHVFNNEYAFLSSKSKSVREHAQNFVEKIIPTLNLNDWVLEIGSNDGYLLTYFVKNGIDVLGIDPSPISVLYASTKNVPTITDFFDSKLAEKILKLKGYPKFIIANNVMAHVPNIQDFMNAISILCNENTTVSIENPSIINILKYNHFDTIYHEHYSYLSANAVDKLAKKFGLYLSAVEKNSIQGESNRYILSKNKNIQQSVADEIKYELDEGLFDDHKWMQYRKQLQIDIDIFYDKIRKLYTSDKTICGYAASSKAVELLNFAKINPKWITSIADDAVEKQNKFLPGLKIPILSMENMLKNNPTDIIIFSWNIYDEIVAKLTNAGYNGNIWKWDDK